MMVRSEVILPRINKLDNCKRITKQVSCKTGFESPIIPSCSSSLYHSKSAKLRLPEVCDKDKKMLNRKSMGEVNSKSSNKEMNSKKGLFISAKSQNSVHESVSAGLPTLKSKGLIHSKLLEPKHYAKNIKVSQQVNLVCKGSNTIKTNQKISKDITRKGTTNCPSTDSICTDPSALKLKLPSNIHRLQSGADCCSVINLQIPLPNSVANGSKNSYDCQKSTGDAKPWQRRKSSICTNVRERSDDAMQVKCNAWEINKHCEEGKGETMNPINNDIAVALEKLIASSGSTFMDKNKSYSVDAQTKTQLSTVDSHKQSSQFSTHNLLSQPPRSPTSNSSDSSDVPPICRSPRVSHRVSLPMGFVSGTSTNSTHLSVKDYIFNLSKQKNGIPLSGNGHHWKQLPPPPMASRLSLLRRNSTGNTETTKITNRLQEIPLHHSTSNCTAELIVEGATEKVEKKMTELSSLVKNGSPSLHTKTPNDSLQINSAKLYANETPRTLKGHLQKKPEQMSISQSEYSYSDPLSGGTYGFQRRISELQEHEYGTIRKERKNSKKAKQKTMKR